MTKMFLDKKKKEPFFVVAANAAFGLYVANAAPTLKECQQIAEESILTGRAYEKLEQLRNFKG